MAFRRSVRILALTALASAIAQEPPKDPGTGATRPEPPKRDHPDGPPGPPRGEGRHRPWWMREAPDENTIRERLTKDLEKLTPEQRTEFWRTVWATISMPPDERKKIIGLSEEQRAKMREEVDATLKEVGLTPDHPRRREFVFRYFGGRKELEEKLIKETDERRKVLLGELVGKLKEDLAKPAPPKPEFKPGDFKPGPRPEQKPEAK